MIAAIAALAVGLVEILFPGPAVFFIFIGAALLAGESKGVARLLDRTELRLRSAASWARRAWNRASIFVRALVLGAAALASGAAAFLTYQWLAD